MPVVRPSEAVVHEMHGVRFVSYAHPRSGSRELCAWRGEIPAGTTGPVHTVGREEILHVLDGELAVTLDGRPEHVAAGDTLIVNAGTAFGIGNPGTAPAAFWVTTPVGLTAELADGTVLSPPWAN
ncbi:cupin domain-containing protein [Streptomyces sp. NPDC090306]|uniref:cupin domain-containing protein n=1 Tax=unclassified Streptomyces TaxID=2593676 RepID=UPI0036EFB84B